jgi:hypothetical protein
MEDAERQLLNISCAWIGLQPSFVVQYAADYNLTDIEADITMLQNLQAVGAPAEYLRDKLKTIARADLAGLDAPEVDKVLAAIDNSAFEVMA